jgi:hypothetical protein
MAVDIQERVELHGPRLEGKQLEKVDLEDPSSLLHGLGRKARKPSLLGKLEKPKFIVALFQNLHGG